jgi:peptidoglycan/xylan/chitin deacetylase (PgdA/CDA1 family)
MYHRFEENKYPSTNIKINDFLKQLEMIKKEKINFIIPKNFMSDLENKKETRKLLLTIDDAFLSFYENAWPILKKNEIPFILFVSTREIGNYGYMTWKQIKEISNYSFVEIGNHSHSHEYLIDEKLSTIKKDLLTSKNLFKSKLKKDTIFFSYPFGEYSLEFKNLVKELGFKFAFGQHSGVVGNYEDHYELPRFPINEKYGELKRFSTLLKTIPFSYSSILPEEKYINGKPNPPKVKIKFKQDIKNINCFSNEENRWRNSKINFLNETEIEIQLSGKFVTERGRINCSLREENGFYRWLGIQFVIAEK